MTQSASGTRCEVGRWAAQAAVAQRWILPKESADDTCQAHTIRRERLDSTPALPQDPGTAVIQGLVLRVCCASFGGALGVICLGSRVHRPLRYTVMPSICIEWATHRRVRPEAQAAVVQQAGVHCVLLPACGERDGVSSLRDCCSSGVVAVAAPRGERGSGEPQWASRSE